MKANTLLFSALALSLLLSAGCRSTKTDDPGFDDTIGGGDLIGSYDDLNGVGDAPLSGDRFDQLPPVAAPANIAPPYFDFGQSVIPPMESGKLDAVAQFLSANPTVVLVVEGHCDERGTNEFNISLGEFRAQAVRNALAERRIDAARIQTISYGEERPANPGHNEFAWSANRRAEFAFYQGK